MARARPVSTTTRRSPRVVGRRSPRRIVRGSSLFVSATSCPASRRPSSWPLGRGAVFRRRGDVPVPAGGRPPVHSGRRLAGAIGRGRRRRYERGPRRLADQPTGPPARLPQSGATEPGLEIDAGGRRLGGIRSSLHAVPEEPRRRLEVIRLYPGERLNRDFILRFRWAAAGDPSTGPDAPPPAPAGHGHQGTFRARSCLPPAAPVPAGRATSSSCSTARAAWEAGRWWRPVVPWRA